jgi:hypothetical protein
MDIKEIQALAQAYNAVLEKACGMKRKQAEANLDPVDQSELKGSHADRKDKDINNDGKVTGTDKYLHKRRKAVSKAVKGETATMNPKMDTEKSEQKESTEMSIRDKLVAVLEKKHGDTEEKQEYDDNWSPGAKKMAADHKPEVEADGAKAAEDDAKAIEKSAKVSPKNSTDKDAKGDKSVINPPEDITKKGGMKESFASMVRGISASYQEMKAPKVEEDKE